MASRRGFKKRSILSEVIGIESVPSFNRSVEPWGRRLSSRVGNLKP